LLMEYEVWLTIKLLDEYHTAIQQLMQANIKTAGSTLCGLKYRSPDGRKSGDPYTSVYNSVLNGLIHFFIFYVEIRQRIRIGIRTIKKLIKMIIQGDDNVLSHIPVNFTIPWKEYMLRFGFDAEANTKDLLDIEFCSNNLYPTSRGVIFGPKPGKVLSKIGFFVQPPNIDTKQLMRGVALGLKQTCNFIPPINAYLDRILELTEGVDATHIKIDEWKLRGVYADSTPHTYVTLINKYGWDFEQQVLWEKQLSTWKFGQPIQNTAIDYMMDCDTSGPRVYSS